MLEFREITVRAYPTTPPVPEDAQAEQAEIDRIHDAIGAGLTPTIRRATPWIAYKLGGTAESLSYSQLHDAALAIAPIAVAAARASRDPERIYANELTYAHVLERAGNDAGAKEAY